MRSTSASSSGIGVILPRTPGMMSFEFVLAKPSSTPMKLITFCEFTIALHSGLFKRMWQ